MAREQVDQPGTQCGPAQASQLIGQLPVSSRVRLADQLVPGSDEPGRWHQVELAGALVRLGPPHRSPDSAQSERGHGWEGKRREMLRHVHMHRVTPLPRCWIIERTTAERRVDLPGGRHEERVEGLYLVRAGRYPDRAVCRYRRAQGCVSPG